MKRALHSPDRWSFAFGLVLVVALAIVTGWGFFASQVSKRSFEGALSDSAREELTTLAVPAAKTLEIERTWVAEGFGSDFLTAPVGPPPCAAVVEMLPYGDQVAVREAIDASAEPDLDVRIEQLAAINDSAPGNLLVAQILGTALIESGRYPEAETVLAKALDRTNDDESIIRAARNGADLDLDDVAVSKVIHVHHALGVARLSQSSSTPPWVSLKNVIGSVKPLSDRRILKGASAAGQPAWSRLLIAAPGCSSGEPTQASLSSYDLYNNLVVGYMRGKFTGGASERLKEFSRANKTYESGLHKLLLAQYAREKANGWKNEAQLWALSNVERIIDWRTPDDARLALNAVQVIDWWTNKDRCPADVCTPELSAEIQKVRDPLVEQMFRRRNVASDQQAMFARGAVRSLATSSLDRARVVEGATAMREWLAPAGRRTLDDLLIADTARRGLPRWLFTQRDASEPGAEAPFAKLGPRADPWYRAAKTDVAAAVARWAGQRSPDEQRTAIIAMHQLLGTSETPPDLAQLEQQRSWLARLWLRIVASKIFWAIVAAILGVLVLLILLWILVHLREWHLLRVSLYNVEHEYLARIDRD